MRASLDMATVNHQVTDAESYIWCGNYSLCASHEYVAARADPPPRSPSVSSEDEDSDDDPHGDGSANKRPRWLDYELRKRAIDTSGVYNQPTPVTGGSSRRVMHAPVGGVVSSVCARCACHIHVDDICVIITSDCATVRPVPCCATCNVTIYDGGRGDPTVDTACVGTVPGPFGVRLTVMDSGATRHMFANKDHFSSYREVTGQFVRVADGKIIPVLGIGTVGPLNEVLHVESLVYNLISESALDKEGKWCIAGNGRKTFYNGGIHGNINYASIFLVATLGKGDLYIVNPMYINMVNPRYNYREYEALASKAEALDLLHRTLGHISLDRLVELVRTGVVEWKQGETPIYQQRKHASPCVACSLAKSKRPPHSGHIRVPQQPGELTYVDVWGPCETESLIDDNIYTIGFIDAASKRA